MKVVSCVVLMVLIVFASVDADAQKKTKPSGKTGKTAHLKNPGKKNVQKPAQKTDAQQTEVSKPATQKSGNVKPLAEGAPDEQKVKDIVSFFAYMLNMLGSSSTSTRDKDVLITESYAKIFRDSKVQIEDDLDEARDVITNKDVVAYLKDVDFFFQDVKFDFAIDNIQQGTNVNGKLFYKVTVNRNLNGIDNDGKAINKTIKRFIEINYDPDAQDLKIVSVYTNEFNEKEALTKWWNDLSYEWQNILKKKLNVTDDSLSVNQLKDITAIDALDLSNNTFVQDIKPLSQLSALKSLRLSQTKLTDLTPIRNLTELTDVDISHTGITDLTPLKYATRIQSLNLAHTAIYDISALQAMTDLRSLNIEGTRVADITALAALKSIAYLNLKNSSVKDITSIQGLDQMTDLVLSGLPLSDLNAVINLKSLKVLAIDSTLIRDLAPLASLQNLREIHANYSPIAELKPLANMPHLEKIYCDQTPITNDIADAFHASNPRVLIIFDSKDLATWWENLSPPWQRFFVDVAKVSQHPSKEALASMTLLDSVNLTGYPTRDLEPLRKLLKLKSLTISNTGISDIRPVEALRELKYLDITGTDVQDITIAGSLPKLEIVRADKSKIEKLDPLYNLKNLRMLYVDNTAINEINAQEFLEHNPACLVIFKTVHLTRWWKNLPEAWKSVFYTQLGRDTTTTREKLHRLVEATTLEFKDTPVTDLSALNEFVRLRTLHFSGTGVSEFPALENLKMLTSLHATNGPLQKLDALAQVSTLEDLAIANTPVNDLRVIGALKNLKKLDCAGTQIKKLNALESLGSLEYFDCSNTFVGNLEPLFRLPLKTLKCYNSKISKREVDEFRKSNPDCTVVYYR